MDSTVAKGPRAPLTPPLAVPPRLYIVDSGTAQCADGPMRLPQLAAPSRTCAAATRRIPTERSNGRTAATPTEALRDIPLVLASRTPTWPAQFAGEISRLGRWSTTSARRARMLRSGGVTKFEGPALGLGRRSSPAGGSFWSSLEATQMADAELQVTCAPTCRIVLEHLSAASGLVSRVQATPVARPAKEAAHTAFMRPATRSPP